eukprot:5473103-Amphidinium_carterae.2
MDLTSVSVLVPRLDLTQIVQQREIAYGASSSIEAPPCIASLLGSSSGSESESEAQVRSSQLPSSDWHESLAFTPPSVGSSTYWQGSFRSDTEEHTDVRTPTQHID